jgi:hypothetical protein
MPPGHWLRKPKEASFTLKNVFFKLLKGRLHKSQDFYTLYSSLTSAPGALVSIFLIIIVKIFNLQKLMTLYYPKFG